jgi:hypothetical protein
MSTLTKEQELNNKAVFIKIASMCDYNNLWTCTHNNSKGKKCTELCKNFTVKGVKHNEK